MTSCDKASFASEVKLDIEKKAARDLQKADREVLVIVENAESHANIFHFFCDGLLPKRVPVFYVKSSGFCDGVGYFDTKLVVFTNKSGTYSQDDTIPFLQCVGDPPGESGFRGKRVSNSVFCSLNWVCLLEVFKVFPTSRAVTPLDTNLPPLSGALGVFSSVDGDKGIFRREGIVILPVVN